MRRSPFELPLALVVSFLIVFYFWTASNGYSFREAPRDGYYDALADALLAGQLHLREEPHPGLFELAEPYEPGRNAPVRLHDASLYHGRYYLYFGVVPALLLFVPWQLVGLGPLPESLATAFFATGGLLFWVAVLRRLLREHCPDTPRWMEAGSVLVLGIANVLSFVLRYPTIYEVAIAGGYFFLAGATFFFLAADGGDRLRVSRLAAAGLFLGLAVGCRPNLLAAAPVLPLLALPAWRAAPGRRRALLALAAPFAVVIFLLGLYNHARFGSWTDFGTRYALAGGPRPAPGFDLRGLPVAFYYHFLAPPDLRLDFPFVFPLAEYPGRTPEIFFQAPFTTGLLAVSPFLLVLLVTSRILRQAPVDDGERLRTRLRVLAATGLVIPLLTSLVFAAAAMRYEVDFASFLLAPALVLLVVADRRVSARSRFRVLVFAALAWSVLAATALSLHGDVDALRQRNPSLFSALERRFEPVRLVLGRLFAAEGGGVFRMRIAFPERAAAEAEPVFASGTPEASDVLWSKQTGPGLFALELRPASGPPQTTRGLPFVPGRFYDLAVELDRVRRFLRVEVDGKEAVRIAAGLGRVNRNRIAWGRGPRGKGAEPLGRFSGTILPEGMLWAGRPGLESLASLSPLPAIHTETAEESDRPSSPAPGLLWLPRPKDGAYVFTGADWRWIPRVYVDRVRVERSIVFAAPPADTVEPLVTSGGPDGADAVFVRHLGGGRAVLGLARWRRGAWKLESPGGPFPLATERAHRLEVVLDRAAGEVTALLDGRELLRKPADLAPLERSGIAVGASPEGLVLGRGAFGGRLEPAR